MASKKGKAKQFPKPSELSDKDGVAWRSTDDIIEIANHQLGTDYKNLSPAIQDWARGHAMTLGWATVHFPMEYPNKSKRAGAVFVKK